MASISPSIRCNTCKDIAGGADGGDRGDLVEAEIVGRSQYRRPAETVADQQDRQHEPFAQSLGCSHEVGNIGGEAGPAEFALAVAKPGEIEPQAGDALTRQCPRHADRSPALLGAGEAMRKQRRAAHQSGRQLQRSGQRWPASVTMEIDWSA